MAAVLGITGPSGAGKSVFACLLAGKGFTVLDCDAIYAGMTAGPSPCMSELLANFGPSVVRPDGSLDRAAMAAEVFAPGAGDRLSLLNRITHRYVLDAVRERTAASPDGLFAVDAPLLFQSGYGSECLATVAVLAPYGARLERLLGRDGAAKEALEARLASSPDDAWYVERCTWTVYNSGSLEGLRRSADGIAADFIRKAGAGS
jgi:dephospho-CoA kinase